MKKYIFVAVILSILIRANNRRMYQVGNTEYALRITNMTDCDEYVKTPALRNIKFTRNGNIQYINGQYLVKNDYCLKLISIKITRCMNNNYACEYFQHWNITEVCVFANMKNSIWGPFLHSMSSMNWEKQCPCFKKTLSNITNGYLNTKEIMTFYPEAPRYHWQIQARVYDRHNFKQNCLYLEFYITSYNSKIPISSTPEN